MAGDWIKVEKSTPTKPEVLAMSAALELDPDACFGKLIRVWSWFDDHTTDGNAGSVTYSVTSALLDRLVGVTGFGSAMVSVGWLVESPSGLQMPHFDYHTSESAKQRALTAKRVAKHKAKESPKSNAVSVTSCVTDALPREEKRREENKELSPTPAGAWKQIPFVADKPDLQDAIAFWLANWPSINGGPQSDEIRIETRLAEAIDAGWSSDKIVRSIRFSVNRCAKRWLDPDDDWSQTRRHGKRKLSIEDGR